MIFINFVISLFFEIESAILSITIIKYSIYFVYVTKIEKSRKFNGQSKEIMEVNGECDNWCEP
jgi:hypothetical protein